MKVLEITHGYYDTKIYRKLFDKLDACVDYCVAIPVAVNNSESEFTVNGTRYYNIPGLQKKRFGMLSNARKCMEMITNKINISEIDIIHTHFLSDALIAYFIKKKYGIPYVTSIRGYCCKDFILSNKLYRRILAKILLKEAAEIIFISPGAKELVVKSFSGGLSKLVETKSSVIPNGIDDYWIVNTHEHDKTIYSGSLINLITVGSINKNKNQLSVAKAIESLREDGLKIVYSLVGDIQDESIFRELCAFDFVKYKGVKAKEQLIDDYRASDIFVLPSYSETFGLVYAEALSQGIPVIYSIGEGFDGQVEENTVGVHVSPYDIDSIKSALLHVVKRYSALKKNCTNISKLFDWNRSSRMFVDIYEKVLSEKKV